MDRTPDDPAREDDFDPGPSIPELAGLAESPAPAEPPTPAFLTNVLDRVNRRRAAAHLMEVTWWGWTDLLLEWIRIVFGALGRRDTERKD